MLRRADILETAKAWQLRPDIVEKDYVLSWILYGLSRHPIIRTQWIFKGGTCLKKCYVETYRFSEDLDFSLLPNASHDTNEIASWIRDVSETVYQESGIEFPSNLIEFQAYTNRRGNIAIKGKIGYVGPLQIPSTPKIKFDLTLDELIVRPPLLRHVYHQYPDRPTSRTQIHCYPIEEMLAEKTLAMSDRCMPRDLYDIIRLFRYESLRLDRTTISNVISKKCSHRGLPRPTLELVASSPRRAELESEWSNMLEHQLPSLPLIEPYLTELEEFFSWLGGKQLVELASAPEISTSDETWQSPECMSMPSEWGVSAPIEAIRFAGANRLRIQIDYLAKEGRRGVREVEPYKFRRSKDGHLLFYGRNITRQRISCYRFDRLLDVIVTRNPFNPWWRVEF